jgi:hypothetical protein
MVAIQKSLRTPGLGYLMFELVRFGLVTWASYARQGCVGLG